MFEQWEETISANTAESDLNRRECKISIGLLTELFVFFPAGCHGLARCRVFLGEKPIAPVSPKNYIAGDDGPVQVKNLLEPVRPNRPVLTWETWNLDDTYDHTLWLGATWTPLEESELASIEKQLKDLNLQFSKLPELLKGRQLVP